MNQLGRRNLTDDQRTEMNAGQRAVTARQALRLLEKEKAALQLATRAKPGEKVGKAKPASFPPMPPIPAAVVAPPPHIGMDPLFGPVSQDCRFSSPRHPPPPPAVPLERMQALQLFNAAVYHARYRR
jgi:hypothetical protein